jgi:hypothetical protein
MAITYPISLPTHTGIRSINLRAVQQQAMTMSAFTYRQQVVAHAGQRWEAEITLPNMKRADAEAWLGWLLSLNGRVGTFLLGDPLGATPRGEAGGTPRVNGASQTGSSLIIDGATASRSDYLLPGDYIQLGSAASSQLYKVTQAVTTDGSGNATVEIWPSLKSSPSDNAGLTLTSAKGLFRLSSSDVDWKVDEASIYGVTFAAIEAIT